MAKKKAGFGWLVKMAWRDSRRNASRLLLFMSSIVLGIAALVAINSFGDNLSDEIDGEAKALLGADLEISSRTPISDAVRQRFDSLGFEMAEELNFASMVYFPKNGGTRLINVRAVEGNFPFYGEIITEPADRATDFTDGQKALVDQTLLLQFDAAPGDSVKVGEVTFLIEGSVLEVPGQSAISTTVAPPVFIPLGWMEETGLNQLGSRISYKIYAKYPEGFDNAVYKDYLSPWLETTELGFDDVAERKEQIGDAYSDLTGFLNLTAFVALILGCIGVAGSVHIYLKEKTTAVAVLRCLGASGQQAMGIFFIQVLAMAIIGSVLGATLGAAIQYFLPALFGDFLVVDVAIGLSWNSIFEGILTGVVAAVLFALLSLIRLRKISPLRAIRSSIESSAKDKAPLLPAGGILVFIILFSRLQLNEWSSALSFSLGILVAFALLAGLAKLAIYAAKRFFPSRSPFVWRQGLANLYRPNNQTLILVVTIGLGTALITTLFISQELLVDKVKLTSAPESRPNMVLFDIQSNQVDEVKELTHQSGLPVINEVPIVTMRLAGIKGRDMDELRADTTSGVRDWVLGREYRVSYRDSLSESETLLRGQWQEKVGGPSDSIFVSLEKRLSADMKVDLGDELIFNVQGARLKTYVGSIREVDWQRMQTNFLVMFPEGVLENAPKFHVLLTRFESPEQSASFQQKLVREFPNISVIDLQLVLETIDTVLSKVSFAIRFMAFFSIFTGLLVLTGSVLISKYQRMQESVLLRTLGARRNQILFINALEYFLLGSLSALSGIAIALIAGSLLAWLSFGTSLTPNALVLLAVYFGITFLTVLIGLSNSRSILSKPPLEVLRKAV
ncbi:MAG: putative ABC transport system permease protein [Cryomorphaceae bacterium]|jgi:putative ABC transport system permease protein